MSSEKIGLGQSLNVLLGEAGKNNAHKNKVQQSEQTNQLYLPIEKLKPGKFQPRKEFDEVSLNQLADSIREQGIIQPLLVRQINENEYEIVAGERRWRAAQLAGLKEVPVFLKEIDDKSCLALAIIENIQRENLNPIEEATSVQRLIMEFELTQDEVGKLIGKARSTVTNLLRLLDLEPDVKFLLEQRKLEAGHARTLLSIAGDEQIKVARVIIDKSLSVRQTEELIQNIKINNKQQLMQENTYNNKEELNRWESTLSRKFNSKVKVQVNAKKQGRVLIQFEDIETLNKFVEKVIIDI